MQANLPQTDSIEYKSPKTFEAEDIYGFYTIQIGGRNRCPRCLSMMATHTVMLKCPMPVPMGLRALIWCEPGGHRTYAWCGSMKPFLLDFHFIMHEYSSLHFDPSVNRSGSYNRLWVDLAVITVNRQECISSGCSLWENWENSYSC